MKNSSKNLVSTDSSGVIAVILAALFMGTMGIFSRKSGLGAEVVTFFRLFFGALFLALFLIIKKQGNSIASRPSWPVIISGIFLAGLIIFYTMAMNLTTLANAVMLLYLAPLVASIAAHFFLGEKLNRTSVLLITTALFGFAMMMEFKVSFSSGSSHLTGLIFGLLSMFCYAAFIVFNRVIDGNIHVYTRSFYQLLTGAVCLIPFLLFTAPTILPEQWLWLAGAGFFPGFLGILLAVIALKKLSTSTFGTLSYLEPISVVIYGWILFDESLSFLQLCGCALIMISSIILAFLTINNKPGSRK